ncbi:MAG: 16S rRNA (guanine(527)-N(7))-methyltransferase RsmG [Elusimicrobia bacterium]|nr:16S rRNA (guanine(527)-N(7))-methyltransferase RsmG [Elusimicrobiota bacterium]
MKPDILKVFLDGLESLNIKLVEEQIKKFSIYFDELKKWNQRFNLIGPATDEEIIKRHFLDSLSVLSVLPSTVYHLPSTVLDIGTGAGFPGIPVKIALPAISLTLLESSKKKTEFLRHLCKKLDIKAEIICDRADNIAKLSTHIGKYDFAAARAVAKLSTAEKLCLPFLKNSGTLILQTGNKTDIKLKQGEIMEKFRLPEEILPGRIVLSIRKKTVGFTPYRDKSLTGFTLIELMIVVALIGILASIAIPKFAEMIRRTKQGKTKGELGNLRSAITLYYSDLEGMLYPQDAAAISNETGPLQTKYLSKMPTVKLGLTSYQETTDIDDFNAGDALTDLGNWGYIATSGSVFVNCAQSDTKGELISSW